MLAFDLTTLASDPTANDRRQSAFTTPPTLLDFGGYFGDITCGDLSQDVNKYPSLGTALSPIDESSDIKANISRNLPHKLSLNASRHLREISLNLCFTNFCQPLTPARRNHGMHDDVTVSAERLNAY